jgi:aminomethyltransferase
MLKTACHDWHVAHGGRMVDFAGWEMPVQYSTITEEHHAVRKAAGLFDIAHMGRLVFTGPDACGLLDSLITNDATQLSVGQIRYSLITNAQGGILDDVLAYRFDDHYLLVVNASNREKIVAWIAQHQGSFNATVTDVTLQQSMLAIQGPCSVKILNGLAEIDVSELKYYHGIETQILGASAIVSRTGYTGEDGFEVIVPEERAEDIWAALMAEGEPGGIRPAGLGCRDTLRLEAAMPLYGHEMDESTDPWTAGLGFGVRLKTGDFIGKDSLVSLKKKTDHPKRTGIILDTKRIAREGSLLFHQDDEVGRVTSGTFSPTLEKSIAMGYLPVDLALPGTSLEIDIRGKRVNGTVSALPFYKREDKS